MTRLLDTFRHAEAGMSLITRRGRARRSWKEANLCRQLEIKTARRLRRSLAGVINEVDTAVMEDLMRILRRLSKARDKKPNEFDKHLKLALELTNMTFSKSRPPAWNILLSTFHEVYRDVGRYFPRPRTKA